METKNQPTYKESIDSSVQTTVVISPKIILPVNIRCCNPGEEPIFRINPKTGHGSWSCKDCSSLRKEEDDKGDKRKTRKKRGDDEKQKEERRL